MVHGNGDIKKRSNYQYRVNILTVDVIRGSQVLITEVQPRYYVQSFALSSNIIILVITKTENVLRSYPAPI